MKEKKSRLRRADLLRGSIAALMVVLAMVAQGNPGPVPLVLALIVMVAFLWVEFSMNRCPHCGRYLGRNWGQFCQHCGERVREEKRDT